MTARDAALVLGGAVAGAAIAILLQRMSMIAPEARLKAVAERARLAEERAMAAAAADEARAASMQQQAVIAEERDAVVTAKLDVIRSEWSFIPKNASGRVDREIFKEHMLETHRASLTDATTGVYDQFLDRCFDAGVGLMLAPGREEKRDLGRHCLSYALLFASEFYFDAAAAAGEACACGTPVADQLALAKTSK